MNYFAARCFRRRWVEIYTEASDTVKAVCDRCIRARRVISGSIQCGRSSQLGDTRIYIRKLRSYLNQVQARSSRKGVAWKFYKVGVQSSENPRDESGRGTREQH